MEGERSQKADHPSAICFLYSVYMQNVVLVPSARIFLAVGQELKILARARSQHQVNGFHQEDPSARYKPHKNGCGPFNGLSSIFNSFSTVNQTDRNFCMQTQRNVVQCYRIFLQLSSCKKPLSIHQIGVFGGSFNKLTRFKRLQPLLI